MIRPSRLCISLGNFDLASLLKQMKQASRWADLIEIRLDKLYRFNSDDISLIQRHAPCPLIWTFRKVSQGGDFKGSEAERFDILSSLLRKNKLAWIDLEADTPVSIIQDLQQLSPHTQWIISWHDWNETPQNLDLLYQRISSLPASYYKICTVATSTTDALRMLNLTRKINQEKSLLCGICMGELGQPTRLLAPMTGQPFTFAALRKGKETAPGQVTAKEMVETYRFREMSRATKLFGLIGRPVDKSASHVTHNAVFRKLSFDAVYLKFHVEEQEMVDFFQQIQSLPIRGLSVTMPFKEKVLYLLHSSDHLTACNTLVRSSEEWKGCNTDGTGAIKALGLLSLKNQKILILGAGGTAKAIAQAAALEGAHLAILNRTLEKAKKLAESLHAEWGLLQELPFFVQKGYKTLIQATSEGLSPAVHEMPVKEEWIPDHALALDVISNPAETYFLKEVKRRGGRTISGQELFIHQAVEQFTFWLGSDFYREKIEKTIRCYLPK